MPFQQVPPDVVLPGFESASASQPHFGETINGDGLFVETDRNDGGSMLLLVDVMGHGEPTAEMMDTLRASLGDAVSQNQQPAELLRYLHGVLEPQWNVTLRFAAGLAILVEGATKDITAANAGQPEPRLGQPGGSWPTWPLPAGTPLGIPDPNALYQDATAQLPSGESLLAFTDGVTEAGAHSGQPQFQHAQMPGFLAGLPTGATPGEVVGELLTALQNHVGATWPDDDTTVICLRRT